MKKVIAYLLIGASLVLFSGCNNTKNLTTKIENQVMTKATIKVNGIAKTVEVKEKTNIMQLMKNNYKIKTEYKDTFIVGIDDKNSDLKKEFWAFYINGKMSDKGVCDVNVKNGDIIEFKLTNLK